MYPIHLILSESEAEAVGSALNRARIAEIGLLRRQGRGDCLAERTIQAIDRVRAQMESTTPPPKVDELRDALQTLASRCASLDQSATHDGLLNCAALAKARAALSPSAH